MIVTDTQEIESGMMFLASNMQESKEMIEDNVTPPIVLPRNKVFTEMFFDFFSEE